MTKKLLIDEITRSIDNYCWAQGITQNELAQEVGVSPATISRFVTYGTNKNFSNDMLYKLCQFFKLMTKWDAYVRGGYKND